MAGQPLCMHVRRPEHAQAVGMCTVICIDMCIDMRADVCITMCITLVESQLSLDECCAGVRIDNCCAQTCMCTQTCIQTCIEACS